MKTVVPTKVSRTRRAGPRVAKRIKPPASKAIVAAVEAERTRLGADLHDGVGQILTGILSLTEALEATLRGTAKREAGRIRELVKEAMQQTRTLSHALVTPPSGGLGLIGSLKQLAANTSNPSLSCEVMGVWEPKFKASGAWIQLFRVAQEAVSNAVRHGKPKSILIYLRPTSKGAGMMQICDDGAGIRRSKKGAVRGIGMRMMHYRMELLGGRVVIRSGAKKGFTVTCHFPCGI